MGERFFSGCPFCTFKILNHMSILTIQKNPIKQKPNPDKQAASNHKQALGRSVPLQQGRVCWAARLAVGAAHQTTLPFGSPRLRSQAGGWERCRSHGLSGA